MGIIELKEVSKIYRTDEVETLALENVNVDIDKGEFVSIMGPSGCGKSTLLNIVGLLDRPTSGTVEIAGKTAQGMGDRALAAFRNSSIGFIFQNFHLIPSLSVADNVELPLTYRSGIGSRERQTKVAEVLERVGLSHRTNHFPSQLSGGQCQRVAIARAIIGNPDIILADEPTGNLDPDTGDQIIGQLHEIARKGTAVIIATHNLALLDRFPGRVLRCADKSIIIEE